MQELSAFDGGSTGPGAVLTAGEAERLIESLRPMGVEDVGSQPWMEQRGWIEKLNLQAHFNAQTHSEEFVNEALASFDKVSVLVHELVVLDIWKEKVFPLLDGSVFQGLGGMNLYMVLYHEATLINLLEIALFHKDTAKAASDDALLELSDYCFRKILYLNTQAAKDAAHKERSAKELLSQTPAQELQDKLTDIRLGTALCALTVLRYLTDHMHNLPLCVLARLLGTHDAPLGLVPLLEERPWVRRRKNRDGKPLTEVFADNVWTEVPLSDRLKLQKPDGQVWLALTNILCDQTCRSKYQIDDFRQNSIARLKRHFNEVLFDQLPILKDTQRAVDEIMLNVAPSAADVKQGRLILEQLPTWREGLLARSDWAQVAKQQSRNAFADSPEARERAMAQVEALTKLFDHMADLEPKRDRDAAAASPSASAAAPAEASAAPPPLAPDPDEVPIQAFRKAGGKWAKWAAWEGKADTRKDPDPVELKADDGFTVRGRRWKLMPLVGDAVIPHSGKVSVQASGRTAEAVVDLPSVSAADTEGKTSEPIDASWDEKLPPAIWVTVGLLAKDGLALQIRARRAESWRDCSFDSSTGKWSVYRPIGGALSVADVF